MRILILINPFLLKAFFVFLILFQSVILNAQKYVLLDKQLAKPLTYTNTITSQDNFNGLFPVAKNILPQFIDVLEEIENKLSSKAPFDVVKQYEVGCIKFAGLVLSVASETRIVYTLTSSCDNVNISMNLAESRVSNASNSFFIKTWITYIRNSIKF